MSKSDAEKNVVALLNRGGKLIRELKISTTSFKIILGSAVTHFPLTLLDKMKKARIIVIQDVACMHSVYKLNKKTKPA